MFKNLQTTIRFQDWDNPLSRPSCWAYPDSTDPKWSHMLTSGCVVLEVGRLASYEEDRYTCRTMFSYSCQSTFWCLVHCVSAIDLRLVITCASLIIDSGLDLTDENVDKIISIVGNDEAGATCIVVIG